MLLSPTLTPILSTVIPDSPTKTPLPASTPISPESAGVDISTPQVLVGPSGIVSVLAFSPDGTALASASGDRTVKVWDASNGELRYTLVADIYKMSSVDFSLDGSFLVSGGIDGLVRLWDVTSGQQLGTSHGHGGEIFSIAFSLVDGIFASSGEQA